MPVSVLHFISASLYVLAYGAATLFAHLNNVHRDFAPIYAIVTVAAVLHWIVMIKQKPKGAEIGPDPTSPSAAVAPYPVPKEDTGELPSVLHMPRQENTRADGRTMRAA